MCKLLLVSFLAPAIAFGVSLNASAAIGVTMIDGSNQQVIAIESPAASGLNGGIFVAPSVSGLRISSDDPRANWSTFSSRGAAYADAITPTGSDGSSSWIDNPAGDTGYVIESNGVTSYLWLIDYSRHPFDPGALSMVSAEGDCSRVNVLSTGSADEIAAYGITGRRFVVDREVQLAWRTAQWDDDSEMFREVDVTRSYEYLHNTMNIEAPLTVTSFRLSGDRFLSAWNREKMALSPNYDPIGIDCHVSAVQHSDDLDHSNEVIDGTPGELGGSTPCTVTFSAMVTEGVLFHEWEFSRSESFDDVYLRAQELEITHTFDQAGTDFVRLHCANATGDCDLYSQVFRITTGSSMLKCPNAFTPANRDGVNDEWRVTYSSIVSFECHIFNRAGHKIATLTHPSQGWDGRYNGKDVPTGAYYYVIKARGGDGRQYNLSGDINVINYK